MTIECPKGCKARWQATGAIHVSRRHLQRAVLVCQSCGSVFTSGLPDALEAAKAVTYGEADVVHESVPVPSAQPFVSISSLKPRDVKVLQVGEGDAAD